LRQTTARVGQLSVFTQASMVIRSAFSIAGSSSTRRRGPLSKRMQLPPQSVLSSRVPECYALGLGGGQHEGQIEGRNVLRVHGAARPRHPLGVLGADVGVALEVLVDDGEAERQVDLLGARLDERLALGIDRDEVLLGDHPAGCATALLELQLVIALDRIERVGGGQHLERATGADLAGERVAADPVGQLRDVQIVLGEPCAQAERRHDVGKRHRAGDRPVRDHLMHRARAGHVEGRGALVEEHPAADADAGSKRPMARDQRAVGGIADVGRAVRIGVDLAAGEPRQVR
jgi:hypothetical protein